MEHRIFMIGSYTWLSVFCSPQLPAPGETVAACDYYEFGGGKGTSQAYAAKILGTHVEVIGRIGDDPAGQSLLDKFRHTQIGSRYIVLDKEHCTGRGGIYKDGQGANMIEIYPGASDHFSKEDFDHATDYVKTCSIGSFQLEVNTDTVFYAIRKTHEMGIETFLDPAPVVPFDEEMYRYVTYIKPNEHEASLLTGIPVTDSNSAVQAGRWFLDHGVNKAAIITLGGAGAVLVTRDRHWLFPTADIPVVDTTAAGDSFAGGFTAAIANGCSLLEAMRTATCVSALAVMRVGPLYDTFEQCKTQLKEILDSYNPPESVG